MGRIASQITILAIVYSIVYSGVDQRRHQSSASLAFVRGIHRRAVNSPHKWPVTRKKVPFDDVIMLRQSPRFYDISERYLLANDSGEDPFTSFEVLIWLPDIILGINPEINFCAWLIWAEVTRYLCNNTILSPASIDRLLNIRITAWPKLGIHANKAREDWE